VNSTYIRMHGATIKKMKLYNKHLNATFETLTTLGTMITVLCNNTLLTELPA